MANSKKIIIERLFDINSIFIFLFFVAFPFGQVIRIGIIHPIDLVVGMASLYAIYKKFQRPAISQYLNLFLLVAFFSWIFSFFIFENTSVFYGFLYLLRIASYFYFLVYVWNFVKQQGNRKLLHQSLLSVTLVSAIFGWIQYVTVPNIKPFFSLGWDMHLYRLVGTFLDPGFLGLIIVFGLLISLNKIVSKKENKYLLLTVFLIISLAFTYSRASYLAFIVGGVTLAFYSRAYKKIILTLLILTLLVSVLPTTRNKSIEFFRTFSTYARIENYKNTLYIFKESPVIGVGFNNMCIAYRKFIGYQSFKSHSCSGSDSSLLLILATTGVTGFMVFIYSLVNIAKFLKDKRRNVVLFSTFAALITHSIFSNSLFYPWILGWMIMLLAEAYSDA